jgi:hypothetical protein
MFETIAHTQPLVKHPDKHGLDLPGNVQATLDGQPFVVEPGKMNVQRVRLPGGKMIVKRSEKTAHKDKFLVEVCAIFNVISASNEQETSVQQLSQIELDVNNPTAVFNSPVGPPAILYHKWSTIFM